MYPVSAWVFKCVVWDAWTLEGRQMGVEKRFVVILSFGGHVLFTLYQVVLGDVGSSRTHK